jgi:CO/xanthine dehydrogenase FAD-binding subunit
MKPAPFDYVRASTVAQACTLLAADADARLIAGGQTLIPLLAMRLARPSRLIDIVRIPELTSIMATADAVIVGAATRQAAAERSAVIAEHVPLFAASLPHVGHAATRSRGTIGGSIAHADPAAEIPLVALTLGAELVVRDALGERTRTIADFFVGPMQTALPAGACVTAVRFPRRPPGRVGVAFLEVSARAGDFAIVAAAAQVVLAADGTCLNAALGIGGACAVPVRLDRIEAALAGRILDEALIREAAAAATAGLETMTDPHVSAAYRRRVAATLARRALTEANEHALRGDAG